MATAMLHYPRPLCVPSVSRIAWFSGSVWVFGLLVAVVGTGCGGEQSTTTPQDPVPGVALNLDDDPSPVRERAIYADAEALIYAGKVEQGLAAADALIAKHPEMARLYYVRGSALTRLNRDAQAYVAFERAVELAPGDALAWTALGRLDAWSRGDLQAARERLTRAVELGPKDVDALLSLALVLHDLHELDGAQAHLARARPLAPKYAALFHESARVAAARGELAAAIDFAAHAAAMDPGVDGLASRLLLARLQVKNGDEAAGGLEFERVLRLADDQADVILAAIRGLVGVQMPDKALDAAQKLVARFPDQAAVHLGLGRVLVALARLDGDDGALASFTRALAIEPKNPAAHLYRTLALASAGRCRPAKKALAEYTPIGGEGVAQARAAVEACGR